jgi:hypothetical protein
MVSGRKLILANLNTSFPALKAFSLALLVAGMDKYLEPYLPSVAIDENGHSSVGRQS